MNYGRLHLCHPLLRAAGALCLALTVTTAAAAPARKAPGKRRATPAVRKPAPAAPKAVPAAPKPAPTAPETLPAAPSAADLQLDALTSETQKNSALRDDMTFVWWIPEDFWRLVLKDAEELHANQIEEVVSLLSVYTIVIVVEGRLVGTQAQYRPAAEVRSAFSLTLPDGRTQKPLADAEIGETGKVVIQTFKPMLAQLLGPLGKNMHVLFFPATDDNGRRLLNPREPGLLAASLRGREFRWRLPLASLVPRKSCPTCKEELSGAFSFCPYDGARLP